MKVFRSVLTVAILCSIIILFQNCGSKSSSPKNNIQAQSASLSVDLRPEDGARVSHAMFAFSALGVSGDLECLLDGVTIEPCESPIQFDSLSEGSHTFEINLYNESGLIEVSESFDFVFDPSLPPLIVESQPRSFEDSAKGQITFSVPGFDSNQLNFQCRIDQQAYSQCQSPFSFEGLSEGSHSVDISLQLSDESLSDPITVSWNVDTIAPTLEVLQNNSTPAGESTSCEGIGGNGLFQLHFRGFDGDIDKPITLEWGMMGQDLTSFETQGTMGIGVSTEVAFDTPHTAIIRLIDPAGNTSEVKRSFILRKAPSSECNIVFPEP